MKPRTQELGNKCEECRERGEFSLRLFHREYSRKFREMFEKIQGTVQEGSRECLRRLWRMLG